MPCTPGVSPRSVPVVTSPAPRSALVRVPTSAPLASRSDATTLPGGGFSEALGSLPAGMDCEQAAPRRRAAMVDGRKRMDDLVRGLASHGGMTGPRRQEAHHASGAGRLPRCSFLL